MNIRVAVIVSTYNACSVLKRVLDAYAAQDRFPDELVVADDGSSDSTADMVAAMTKTAKFPIKYITQPDEGFRLAKVRNEAVKATDCDYLIFTDGSTREAVMF